MIIGCDVDGVLADFNTAFIARVIRVTSRNLFPEGYVPHIWDYPETFGYTRNEVSTVWSEIKTDMRFWQQLPLYETTEQDVQALDKLRRQGNDVYFITNRMGVNARLQTERWIRRRGFDSPTVLLTPHKGLASRALDLTHYIDDRIENVIDVAQTKAATCLMNRKWNEEFSAEEYAVRRVNSVQEMFA